MPRTFPPSLNAPRTILVYSCGETIGDGLFKLPFLADMRRRFPAARITWLAGLGPSIYASALASVVTPLLDEVIEYADIGNALPLPWLPRPLANRQFDLVIDTQMTLRRSLNARRIRHTRFISPAAGFLLSDMRPAHGQRPGRHLLKALSFLLDLAAPPALPATGPHGAADFDPVPDACKALAASLLPEGPVYIGIAPGAGDRVKLWPEARFLAVAREQAAKGRVPVFLAGPEEAERIPVWRAAVPEALFPEHDRTDDRPDLKGPLLVMALAARMAAALANDSGSGHMLAIGGAPLVSLFSKHDPAKYAPSATRLTILDAKTYGGRDPELIPQAEVAEAMERMLAARPPGATL